jgi:hypothetical protein
LKFLTDRLRSAMSGHKVGDIVWTASRSSDKTGSECPGFISKITLVKTHVQYSNRDVRLH